MIEPGWDEYRGWAARSRQLQAQLRRWNRASLACAVAAAVFGGLAIQLGPPWARAAALGAAVAAALAPVIGREMLSSAVDRKWLRVRALAEGIKSECFRVAARLPPYDGPDALARFIAWRSALTSVAAAEQVTSLADPAPPEGDKRRPPAAMDAAWYLRHRLGDQKAYYAKGQRDNERIASRLRWLSVAMSLLATACAGAAAAGFPSSAWVGVFVTVSTAVVAVGLLEKRHFLAAEYGAMVLALGRIEESWAAGQLDFAALVDRTETLLGTEHAAWAQAMARFQSGGGAAPPAPSGS